MTSVINIVLAYNLLKLIIRKILFLTEDPFSGIFKSHPLSATGTMPKGQKSLMPSEI